jgi:hypothetical protein
VHGEVGASQPLSADGKILTDVEKPMGSTEKVEVVYDRVASRDSWRSSADITPYQSSSVSLTLCVMASGTSSNGERHLSLEAGLAPPSGIRIAIWLPRCDSRWI